MNPFVQEYYEGVSKLDDLRSEKEKLEEEVDYLKFQLSAESALQAIDSFCLLCPKSLTKDCMFCYLHPYRVMDRRDLK